MSAVSSHAQILVGCTPPTYDEEGKLLFDVVSGGTITCILTDLNGFYTDVSNLTINVDLGGSVTGPHRGFDLGGSNYTLNNRGSITGPGTQGVGDGIHIQGSAGTINNWGTIHGGDQDGVNLGESPNSSTTLLFKVINHPAATISGVQAAIRLNRPGAIDNQGTLEGGVGVTVRQTLAGTVDNFGVINATGRGIDIDRSDNVTVINHLGADITSENAAGIESGDSNNIQLLNGGTITSSRIGMRLIGNDSQITNEEDAIIRVLPAENHWAGVILGDGNNISFLNAGTVISSNYGVTIKSTDSTVENNGIINSDTIGIRIENTASGTEIYNNHTLTGAEYGMLTS
jgi:hypothetical protein